jgi:RNA polymerase sigma factor (sigma-70 family)
VSTLPPVDQGTSPAELFAAFKAGYQALGQLLEQHREYLLKIVNDEIDSRLVPRQGASDIVQNAFLDILENLQRHFLAVGAEEDLPRWLRRVCANALKKEHRYESAAKRDFRQDQTPPDGFDQQASDPSPSSACGNRERDALLGQAVNALPPEDRLLLRLRECHDWTYEALAELLDGQASDAGRMRMQRLLTQLLFRLRSDNAMQDLQS